MDLKFDLENPQYEYVTTVEHANKVIDLLFKEKVIGVDVESTSLEPYTGTLLTLQIGTDKISYIFDARKLPMKEMQNLKDLLEDKKIIKILHNGKFDYKYTKVHTGIRIDNIYDTMLAEVVLNAGIGKGFYSLKSLALKYADVNMDKAVRTTFLNVTPHQEFTEDQLRYGAIDTLILFPVFEAQVKRLKKENMLHIAKLEFVSTRVVGEMELNGLYLDEKRWRGIIKNLEKRRDELAIEFQNAIRPFYNCNAVDLFGNYSDCININSQSQLLNLFNDKLHLDMPSTGVAELDKVDHPIVNLLKQYRGYEKLVSAFGDKLLDKINPVTHRIHPEFNQLGAATGRFSCNNPNLQQIPRNSEEAPFRECMNPEPGYQLVTADYSSMEMRILADLSDDQMFIKALNDGLDLHSFTASLMFGIEYTPDFKKKHPKERQAAKAINFGLMYGMGAGSLARQIGVSPEEGNEYMEKYFKSYPSVRDFLAKQAHDAVKKGFSTTPMGRKRYYNVPEKSDPEYRRKISSIERRAKNHPIQGTNADAIKYALVYLQERAEKEGIDARLVLTVHDEIVSEVRNDQAEYWAKVQSDEMIRAAKLFVTKVPIISDPFVGQVWEH
jgi:DNA polymerase I-like protein with 3'-5' exonuclease and polymerase domains